MRNTKKKPALSKAILNLILVVPTFFSVLGKIVTLVELETQLAGKSLIRLVVLSVTFGILLTATWIALLAMLFVYLQSLLWTPLESLFLIIILNVIILAFIAFGLGKTQKNLFFPEIRNQIRHLQKLFRN